MHANMFRRVTLTEDVGTLEMMKRNFDFSSDRRGIGGAQLSLVRISEFEVHGLYHSTSVRPNVEAEKPRSASFASTAVCLSQADCWAA